MPWKNGAGFTTELMVEPASATLATGFLWRLSMAAVATSGPFSRFPGLDRTLLLLEGQGLRVDHEGHGSSLLAGPLEACAFPGEWATQGTLVDGPCLDFNVMSDRRAVRHEVSILHPGPQGFHLPQGPVVLVFCAKGRVTFPALEVTLEARNLLRLDARCADGVVLEPDTALIVVAIHPVSTSEEPRCAPF